MEKSPPEIEAEKWKAIQKIYQTPNSIDLFVGGLAENHVHGELLCSTIKYFKFNKSLKRWFGWTNLLLHNWYPVL